MEPASLAVGILPLAAAALESYRTICVKIKVFRHSSSEARRFSKKLKIQRCIFVNACVAMFWSVVHEDPELRVMMDNLSDDRWRDPTAEKRVRESLCETYECCRDTVDDIGRTLKEIEEETKSLEGLLEDNVERSRIRRLRQSLKLAFNTTQYENYIDALRESNSDLRQLIDDSRVLSNYSTRKPRPSRARNTPSPDFSTIQKAASELSDWLSTSWRCADDNHGDHCARLCLNGAAQVGACRNTKVVQNLFLCYEDTGIAQNCTYRAGGRAYTQFGRIGSTIRLVTVESTRPTEADVSPPSLPTPSSMESFSDEWVTRRSPAPASSCLSRWDDRSAKRRKVQTVKVEICQGLTTRACCENRRQGTCTGLVAAQKAAFNHVFHSAPSCTDNGTIANVPRGRKPVSLLDIVKRPLADAISTTDQLKLAQRLVAGVLTHHSSKWLTALWDLKEVYLFCEEADLSDKHFESLHLTRLLPQAVNSPRSQDENVGIPSQSDHCRLQDELLENEMLMYGIRNLTLYSLGVALLEIGYWRELELRNVVEVRKLAHPKRLRHPICPRYQELTRKCLDCDFGFGSNLDAGNLQSAVYSDIMGGLDELIANIDLKDG